MMPEQYNESPIPAHLVHTTTAFASVEQSKKRVRFQPSITVQPIDSTMTQYEKASSYYTKDELDTFQLEVKVINTLFKMGSNCGSHRSREDCAIGTNADPALYELRVRNKIIAQKALLKYQKNLNARDNITTEQRHRRLATASAKLSKWSKEMSLKTAKMHGLAQAYDGDYMVPISTSLEQVSSSPASIKRRRLVDEEASQNYKRLC